MLLASLKFSILGDIELSNMARIKEGKQKGRE
jgi:hypothetical protein